MMIIFTDLQYLLQDGKQIQISGEFVQCGPTRDSLVCYTAFRASNGYYFLLSNLQEIIEANPDLLQLIRSENSTVKKFYVTGIFTYGTSDDFPDAATVGTIRVTSLTMTDNTRFKIP